MAKIEAADTSWNHYAHVVDQAVAQARITGQGALHWSYVLMMESPLEVPPTAGALPDNPQFAANLAAFETHAPDLHAQFSRLTQPMSELVLLPGGGVDMSLQGQLFYGADAVQFTQLQLDAYLEVPLRLFFNEPDPVNIEGIAGDYCRALCGRMKDQGIELNRGSVGKSSHFTIVFGAGLGLHIEPLIQYTECKVLLIVDPTLESIFHSLSVVDWASIFAEADANGREIIFIVEDSVDAIVGIARNAIRARNPALLDGIYVYAHYHNSLLKGARDRFQRELFLHMSGLGFFEDELRMMANTCSNLGRGQTTVINRQVPLHDTPLFVVGSGPSIDGDIGFLKENRDRAIVMSIGTGLRGLLAHGITPDYHVELENEFTTAYLIRVVAEEFDLSGITLIGSYTVQKKVADRFDDTLFYFRERTSSSMLFGDGIQEVSPSGPTVANTAIATALRFGFKDIYLFGLDMGSKNKSRYHSSGSVYGIGALEELDAPDTEVPGNFGGTAYAENVLLWCRFSFENMLRVHRYVNCTNCSDGARIAHAIPRLSRTIEMSNEPVDREAVKQRIRDGASVLSESHRRQSWYLPLRRSEIRVVVDAAYSCLDQAAEQDDPDLEWMHQLADSLRYESGGERSAAQAFFYGTVLLMLGCSWWYDRRLADPEQRSDFRKVMLAELRSSFEQMDQRLGQLYQEIEDYFNGDCDLIDAPHETERPDNRQPVAQPQ